MSFGRFALGALLMALVLGPVALGAWRVRARVLPAWSGGPARVAEAILAVAALVLVATALGVAGRYSIVPVVLGCLATGAALWWWGARAGAPHPTSDPPPPAPPAPRWSRLVAVGLTAVLAAEWAPRTIDALHRGMSNIDTLWYHLPVAARFVQDGGITALHYLDGDAVTVFYPANSSLLHGLGMLAFGEDVLSPVLNLAWLALALAAAWCLGRPFGVGPASIAGVAVVFALPGLATTQPGGAYNDVVGLALLLAAAAVLVQVGPTRPAVALAALAGGVAIGVKLTLLAPVGALALGVVAIAAGRRVHAALWWLGSMAACSGVWYARNLVEVGNPLPSLGFGPLPSPATRTPIFTIAEFLFERRIWSQYFLPGLESAYGPAWWAVVALALGGLVLAVALPASRTARMLGVVGLVSGAAYVVTPQFLGLAGEPIFFVYNLRYAAPALVLGLGLLAVAPRLALGLRLALALGTTGAVLLATQLDPSLWPTDLRSERFVEPIRNATAPSVLLGAVLALAGGAWVFRDRLPRPGRRWAAAGALVAGMVALLGGWRVANRYVEDRYTSDPYLTSIYRWAKGTSDERIAIAGFFLQYPLTGERQSNRVQFLGQRGEHGAYAPYAACRAWRAALGRGGYRWVVTAPTGFPVGRPGRAPEARWIARDPGVRLVRRDRTATGSEAELFHLDGPLSPRGCPRGAAARRDDAATSGTAPG